MIIAKFGGTSMGTAQSIQAVAQIISERKIKAAVVSATSGTTDMLIQLGQKALKAEEWQIQLQELTQKHDKIIQELQLDLSLAIYYENLEKILAGIEMLEELSLSAKDRLMSFGERMSSQILAALLQKNGANSQPIDAHDIVFCDNTYGEGEVDFSKTNAAIQKTYNATEVPVITGFVAQSADGHYITLGRGGSDYTGAIIAAALKAEELQIWTDVDGILNADPRLIPEAKVLPELSFGEAGELAYFGAKVIHPKTIQPAIEQDIPVKILNTFNPSAPGTVIKAIQSPGLKSVTYKKGINIINICSSKLLNARGFLARIFEVFARHGVSVDVVSTSEVSVSVTVDEEVQAELVAELEEFANVELLQNMAIVCLVGDEMKQAKGVLGKLFTALEDHYVNMVSVGASKRNISFLVDGEEAPEVVKKVFNTFFL